ncbi:MAG: hypothetical protein ACOCXT_01260 [Candidatus Dojkabacteria bacterium]
MNWSIFPENQHLPSGYASVFVVCILLAMFTIIFAPGFNHRFTLNFSYKDLLNFLVSKKDLSLKFFIMSWAFREIGVIVCVGILSFIILQNEFNVGLFTSLLSLFGTIFGKNIVMKEFDKRSVESNHPQEMYILMREFLIFPSRLAFLLLVLFLVQMIGSGSETARLSLVGLSIVSVSEVLLIYQIVKGQSKIKIVPKVTN